MKKTLLTCMAAIALFAIAGSATAITCTIDQRPAATLLVPYFAVAINSDGSYPTSSPTTTLNTYVTITNASSSPMIAHVSIYNRRSELALDFNVALTGYDVQSMDIGSILQGNIPATPSPTTPNPFPPGSNPVDHARASGLADDPCFRNPASVVFPAVKGYARIKPSAFADPANDPSFATTVYPQPAYLVGSTFWQRVLGTLDGTNGTSICPGGVLPAYTSPLEGYIVIDHVNYCTLANPDNSPYYSSDAIGMENNLMGEVLFVSGAGIPTFGGSTVNIEASRLFSNSNFVGDGAYAAQTNAFRERTFYARYWAPSTESFVNAANSAAFATNPWNQGFGDEREPLGLRYAVRYFEGNGIQSYLRVWRSSSGALTNLLGSSCATDEQSIVLVIFDEDENPAVSASQPPCPSPPINCQAPPPYNFPKETQRIRSNLLPPLPPVFLGAQVGWLEASFVNTTSPGANNGKLDQAWMDYEFQGATAFTNASIPGTQLDPTTCQPLLLPLSGGTGTVTDLIVPAIPLGWVPGGADGLFPNPPTGTGP